MVWFMAGFGGASFRNKFLLPSVQLRQAGAHGMKSLTDSFGLKFPNGAAL
jgi:hypothetical protein